MPRCLKLTAAQPDSQVNSACFNTPRVVRTNLPDTFVRMTPSLILLQSLAGNLQEGTIRQ